jgi:hypothetical protein
MFLSMDSISVPIAPYCRASTSRMSHTAGDTRRLALLFAAFAPLQQLTIRSFSLLACVSLAACAWQECRMVESALGSKAPF